jgi:hypothetical protein
LTPVKAAGASALKVKTMKAYFAAMAAGFAGAFTSLHVFCVAALASAFEAVRLAHALDMNVLRYIASLCTGR